MSRISSVADSSHRRDATESPSNVTGTALGSSDARVDSSRQLNVIALSPNFWSGQWMNRQYLLTRLGRHHNVVYSTGAWTVWERATAPWKRAGILGRAAPSDNVVVEEPPRFLLRWPKHAW